MGWLHGALTSARLTLKIHRFEVVAVTLAMLGLSGAALLVKAHLDSVGVNERCLEQWIAGGPIVGGSCALVERWASITEGEAGKVMAAMFVVPFAAGLLLGVPLVGRELESRTASVAWALAGSRRRWFVGRLTPILLLAVGLAALSAVTASILETTRSADGVWSNSFHDSSLFGLPVVAHTLLGLGLGLLAGAVIGRTLPALIVGSVFAVIVGSVVIDAKWAAYPPPPEDVYSGTGPGLLDPTYDVRWITPDGGLLKRDQALVTVPAGTTDVLGWLQDHYRPMFLGADPSLTAKGQQAESLTFLGMAGALLLVTFPVLERRRPR